MPNSYIKFCSNTLLVIRTVDSTCFGRDNLKTIKNVTKCIFIKYELHISNTVHIRLSGQSNMHK